MSVPLALTHVPRLATTLLAPTFATAELGTDWTLMCMAVMVITCLQRYVHMHKLMNDYTVEWLLCYYHPWSEYHSFHGSMPCMGMLCGNYIIMCVCYTPQRNYYST